VAEITLSGCRCTPLAGYLKGLGVFRLVAEQTDAGAKGFWRDGALVLETTEDRDALIEFFTNAYRPTPIVAPWNGGSGFFPGDATDGRDAILAAEGQRLSSYRDAIESILEWPEMQITFETVQDVASYLEKAAAESRPGKTRTKFENEATDIGRLIPLVLEEIGQGPSTTLTFGDLEHFPKPQKKKKTVVTELIKAAKKGRTSCIKRERDRLKETLLATCRSRLPESCLDWLDAAVAIRNDGTPAYNPVLGSGGNEGRLDYSNNFMQRIAELFLKRPPNENRDLFIAAVFGDIAQGMTKAKIGQFHPGRAGGYNQGAEVETKDFKINPWDFVLMLEGATALSGAVVRRINVAGRSTAAIPFTVRFSPVGFASSEQGEDGRAETWLPSWSQPATYGEIRYLFGEGRSAIGRRTSANGLDFTRSLGALAAH